MSGTANRRKFDSLITLKSPLLRRRVCRTSSLEAISVLLQHQKPMAHFRQLKSHVFPESLGGPGEGTRAWDLDQKSSMSNGTVAQKSNKRGENKVSKIEG